MTDDDQLIGSAELREVTGLSFRRVDWWTRKGWIRPVNPAAGAGEPRLYPRTEGEIAALAVALVDEAGFTPKAAARWARAWWDEGGAVSFPLGDRFVITDLAAVGEHVAAAASSSIYDDGNEDAPHLHVVQS